MSAEVAHQLSIFVANKPGVLGKVCDLLKKEKINIFAITTSDNRDHSIIRLVVDNHHRALDLLEDFGTLVQKTDVIMIDGANRSGTIGEIARRLGEANITSTTFIPPRHPRQSSVYSSSSPRTLRRRSRF